MMDGPIEIRPGTLLRESWARVATATIAYNEALAGYREILHASVVCELETRGIRLYTQPVVTITHHHRQERFIIEGHRPHVSGVNCSLFMRGFTKQGKPCKEALVFNFSSLEQFLRWEITLDETQKTGGKEDV